MSASEYDRPAHAKAGRVVYDAPAASPRQSAHWERVHRHLGNEGACDVMDTHEALMAAFAADVASLCDGAASDHYLKVAVWSCVVGYCETLSTHKDATRRFAIFPVPLSSLRRLVENEFLPLLYQARDDAATAKAAKSDQGESLHRRTVRAVANAIWKKAQNKKSSMQDELHANSLYACMCGDVDKKSLDCFGAALLVVVGMNILGSGSSCLALSEDHAYESHREEGSGKRATCEVAIPGNTKDSQSKRGKEISYTFEKQDNITAETSWLYMAKNPVICTTPGMVLAAALGNLNCDIDKQKPGASGDKPSYVSGPLYKLKRDMLWILHDAGYMDRFPFALMELGEAEEHLSSPRGMELVDVSEMLKCEGTLVLRNEKLFLDAIDISRSMYDDAQVYPYLYAGHYHKDAGRDDRSQEYRLVESLRLYAEAARVASAYKYDTKDCIQLIKHMTSVAGIIQKDIIRRTWEHSDNATAAATWLIGFFDRLLFWEEKEQRSFVEVLNVGHKHGIDKLLQPFSVDVRVGAVAKMHSNEEAGVRASAVTESQLLYFRRPRSKRLRADSLLTTALAKERILARELEMALPSNGEGRGSRQRKRARV
ncbi:hypothetical protein ACHAXT_011217 [Thalassiosira profunda]